VTVSGDTTVKLWDFAKAECIHTFLEHQKAGEYTNLLMRQITIDYLLYSCGV